MYILYKSLRGSEQVVTVDSLDSVTAQFTKQDREREAKRKEKQRREKEQKEQEQKEQHGN